MPDAIVLDQVWKFYGDYAALRDYTLSVAPGSCCALLGRNGAGKTTLLRILAGLTPFQRGTVRVLGEKPRSDLARREVGFLGHGIGVYEDLVDFGLPSDVDARLRANFQCLFDDAEGY